MIRGNSQQMPISPPDKPTLVKRNRKFADSARTRMSDAAARTAPAPAATPLTAAITGCGSSRRLRTQAPVMVGELEDLPRAALEQLADDLVNVAARAKSTASPTYYQHLYVAAPAK